MADTAAADMALPHRRLHFHGGWPSYPQGAVPPKPVFNLTAALFWTAVDDMVEPKAAEPTPPTTKRMMIASFNTRSLVDEGSRMAVSQQMCDGGVDMCGVQEGRSREQRFIETDGFFVCLRPPTRQTMEQSSGHEKQFFSRRRRCTSWYPSRG